MTTLVLGTPNRENPDSRMPILAKIGIIMGGPPPKSGPPPEVVFSTKERMNKASNVTLRFGDIAVKDGRSAIDCTTGDCLWPKAKDGWVSIPYTLDSQYTSNEKQLILQSMLEFSSLTCVRFVPRTAEANYLNIIADVGLGCWSYLGRSGGLQEVSLDRSQCLIRGVIQHELNHAIGFVHEHSRSDRDNYVKILWQNIVTGYSDSFAKVDTNNLGLEYDYKSVMHYDNFAFAKSYYQPTIQTIPDSKVVIGQRLGLSNLDVAKIKKLYNCNVCSSVIPGDSGELVSPSYPSNYPNNYNCSWLIRTPNSQVFLEFKAFDVQSSANCSSDYIRVYDGPSRSSPLLLDRTCGSGKMPSLVASGTVMLVDFVTDSSVTATGFKASFSKVTCGGTYTTPTGTFTTPGYGPGSLYPPFSDCTWTILAPTGYKVNVAFSTFGLEPSPTCAYDFLEIRDGMLSTSPLMGNTHCGTSAIPPVVSTQNAILLHFISDDYVQSAGFLVKYSFVPA
ncbi:embryonic protein UVS.2-like [Hyla sarda]|uniref:embryonic protein UVS.2-like n=1 Tax=Hyla sarda TaxID=327740 RepID=UPI0024C37931|nr:embryonic protein UVS.2-like [Hyla sarda]